MLRRGLVTTVLALTSPSTAACSLVSLDGLSGGTKDDASAAADGGGTPHDSGSDPRDGGGDAPSCSGGPGELAFTTLGSTQVVGTDWANAPLLPALDRGECPVLADDKSRLPSRSVVVLNATGGPGRISAWGSCSAGSDDIHVAVYARSTPPTTTSELGACTGFSAAWFVDRGSKRTSSPENSGSSYCNGLTATDVNLTLGPCERAVVVFQHSDELFGTVGPARGKIRLE